MPKVDAVTLDSLSLELFTNLIVTLKILKFVFNSAAIDGFRRILFDCLGLKPLPLS